MLIHDINRPSLLVLDEAGNKISEHRDQTEAVAAAVAQGVGYFTIIQPPITVRVTETD